MSQGEDKPAECQSDKELSSFVAVFLHSVPCGMIEYRREGLEGEKQAIKYMVQVTNQLTLDPSRSKFFEVVFVPPGYSLSTEKRKNDEKY